MPAFPSCKEDATSVSTCPCRGDPELSADGKGRDTLVAPPEAGLLSRSVTRSSRQDSDETGRGATELCSGCWPVTRWATGAQA